MKIKHRLDGLSDEKIQELRSETLGASDIARINTGYAMEVYLNKIGKPTAISPELEERFEWGRKLEPVVLNELKIRLREDGCDVEDYEKNIICEHPEHKEITFSPDEIITVNSELVVVQAKTAEVMTKAKWDDGPPPYPLIQNLVELEIVPEAAYGIIPVLIGLGEFRFYKVERHDIGRDLVMEAVRFYKDYIQQRVAPPPGMYDVNYAIGLYPEASNTVVVLSDEYLKTCEEYREMKAQEQHYHQRRIALQDQLKLAMKENKHALCGPHPLNWSRYPITTVRTKMLKEKYPKIYNEVKQVKLSQRFGIGNEIEASE